MLAVASVVVSVLNYRRTRDDITIALLISLIGIVWCASLHEGEHWRHMWLFFGLTWGLCTLNFSPGKRPAARGGSVPAPSPPAAEKAGGGRPSVPGALERRSGGG